MSDQPVKRKLTAILYADIAGYSRLSGRNELATHQQAMEILDYASEAINAGGGKVLRYAGDAILAEFESAIAATETSVGIQRHLESRNHTLDKDEKIQIRIGLNLGEVIQDRGEIYGDGVNLSARLEAAAIPGGICVGSYIHEQVAGKVDIEFDDGGEQIFKNIEKPVQVYHWHPDGSSSSNPGLEKPMASKPSIAVLPFDNMSADPDQTYFSDGITEDIITDLSRFRTIEVTARNSSFSFRDRQLKVCAIADELNVDYVLEGSIRRSGDKIRLTAQLIDGKSEKHVWAERYDRQIEDIFEVQDELTRAIVVALSRQIELEVLERANRKAPENMDAYDHVLRGRELTVIPDHGRSQKARVHFEKAIELDALYSRGWSALAISHLWDWNFAWSKTPDKSLQQAQEIAQKAYELDSSDTHAISSLAICLFFSDEQHQALRLFEQAVKLNPNAAESHRRMGMVLTCFDDQEKAMKHLRRSMELNPLGDPISEWFLAITYFNNRQYELSIETHLSCRVDAAEKFAWLAAAYAQNGQLDQAVEHGARFMQGAREEIEAVGGKIPESWQTFLLERAPFVDPPIRNHFIEAMNLAKID